MPVFLIFFTAQKERRLPLSEKVSQSLNSNNFFSGIFSASAISISVSRVHEQAAVSILCI